MPFIHKGKRNTLIWDGMENGIHEKKYEIDCPNCGCIETYNTRDIKSIDQLPQELSGYLLQEKIISQSELGHKVKKGIPAYIVEHQCNNCNLQFSIILGLKEIQPQRYNIFYKSSVYSR
jgi:hypothetical protein